MLERLIDTKQTVEDSLTPQLFIVGGILLLIYFLYHYIRDNLGRFNIEKVFNVIVGCCFVVALYFAFMSISNATQTLANVNQDAKSNNVSKYYDLVKQGELLKFERRNVDGAEFLKENETAKIIKEEPKSYQVEYQGEYFEVKKGGIENVRKID